MDLSSIANRANPDELITLSYPTLIYLSQTFPFLPSLESILSSTNQDFWYNKYCRDYGVPKDISMRSPWLSRLSQPLSNSNPNQNQKQQNQKKWKDRYQDKTSVWFWLQPEGNQGESSPPHSIPDLTGISSVSSGLAHLLLVGLDGRVYGVGQNSHGQLICPKQSFLPVPEVLSIPSPRIIQTACGNDHSLALDSEGQVWIFGSNIQGQLGLNDSPENRYWSSSLESPLSKRTLSKDQSKDKSKDQTKVSPTQLELFSREGFPESFTKVVAHANHSLLLSQTGRVYVMGSNDYGQLGVGSDNKIRCPTEILFCSDVRIIDLSTSISHTLLLSDEGLIYSCGSNSYGQLGSALNTNRTYPFPLLSLPFITRISTGSYHSLAIDQDQRVWGFGLNHRGQLGLKPDIQTLLRSKVNSSKGLELILDQPLTPSNLMLQDEDHIRSRPTVIPGLSGMVAVSGGYYHSLFLDNQGQVWITQPDLTITRVPHLSTIQQISSYGHHNLAVGWNVIQRISQEEFQRMLNSDQIRIELSPDHNIIGYDDQGHRYQIS